MAGPWSSLAFLATIAGAVCIVSSVDWFPRQRDHAGRTGLAECCCRNNDGRVECLQCDIKIRTLFCCGWASYTRPALWS